MRIFWILFLSLSMPAMAGEPCASTSKNGAHGTSSSCAVQDLSDLDLDMIN